MAAQSARTTSGHPARHNPAPAFTHRGVVYSTDRRCADALVRRARPAIARGEPVLVLAAPPVEEHVRSRLGDDPAEVGYRPYEWLGQRAPSEIVDSAFEGGPILDTPVTVFFQQPRHESDADAFWMAAECTANATLGKRPVDLTCFVDEHSTQRNRHMARVTHPLLGGANSGDPNLDAKSPDFSPPEQILFQWPAGSAKPVEHGPIDYLYSLNLTEPTSARGWLRALARTTELSPEATDDLLVLAGEAVMTGWEARSYLTVAGTDRTTTRLASGSDDSTGGVSIRLWQTPTGLACDVIVPVQLAALSQAAPPDDLRMRWLWMAALIAPHASVTVFDRDDAPGSCIRVQVSET